MTRIKDITTWQKSLKAGSWVVVRAKEEIVATLDANATLQGLPFQPEMFEFCGQRLRIAKVAHKTCDNIEKTGGRRMANAFHLEGARCDGGGHGGCQADCVFFWKAEWLRPETSDEGGPSARPNSECTVEDVYERVTVRGESAESENPTWVCQTTALYDATELLPWWDVRQYVRDVTSGNHSAWHMIKLLIAAGYRKLVSIGIGYTLLVKTYNAFQKLAGGNPYPAIDGEIAQGQRTPSQLTDLKVGEWVEVKSGEEIARTITTGGLFNRGMRYDPEMLKYSGNRYRVQMRIDRLINEVTGKMMEMQNPCIQLEDVYCRAECTQRRLGCPRASNTYWREIWLRRVEGPESESD
jgi:hypothetical protein